MEVKKQNRRRRTHSEGFKQAVIAACCEAGASIAGIALANELNANQVRRWMRERGIEPPSRSLPVRSTPAEPAFVPVPIPPIVSSVPDIRIEVRRGNTAVKIEWPGQAASDCAAWLRDWLR